MELEYKGGNCVEITVKKTTIVSDPKLSAIGFKDQGTKARVQLVTQPQFEAPRGAETLVFNMPGEYEVDNISIKGIAAQAHMDPKDKPFAATMFTIRAAEVSVAIVGHISADISEAQLEELGIIDVLVVPVGGNGYTLDATGAVQLVRKIDPKIVVPTHYAENGVTYEVPQAELELFTKELGVTVEEQSKLKLKVGAIAEALTVQRLKRVG